MRIIGIIPGRMASSRFPGKPLAKICGVPMIGHIYFRCKMASVLDEVYLATCDEEIRQYAESIGTKAVMTSDKHERASDRVAEAMLKIEKETGQRADIIVMIQGDEPMIVPDMIELSVQPMIKDKEILVVNLMSPVKNRVKQEDPNEVKVVVDKYSNAMYFSREPIPSGKKTSAKIPVYRQLCIIPFRRDFLIEYSHHLEPTPLEKVESIDMLRILEHGYKVKMVPIDFETYCVDTPEDLSFVENLMQKDPLVRKYSEDNT